MQNGEQPRRAPLLILHSFQMRELHADDLPVPPEAIGANGHANIVEFVRWMQPEPRT